MNFKQKMKENHFEQHVESLEILSHNIAELKKDFTELKQLFVEYSGKTFTEAEILEDRKELSN